MSGGTGYLVPAGERDAKLSITRIPLPLHAPTDDTQKPSTESSALEGEPGSGLTPPPTPIPPAKDRAPTTYARARIVLTAKNAVQSLLPATLLSQAESLLSASRVADVLRLLDGVKKKGGDEDQVSYSILLMKARHSSIIDFNRICKCGIFIPK